MLGVLMETFFIVFLAEMGDKSQFLMVAMRADYRWRDILIGTVLSVVTLCSLAVMLGGVIGDMIPKTAVSLIAGLAFLLFATFGDSGDSEEKGRDRTAKKYAVLSVFGTYFLAELGDKTQLSALTLSAISEGGFWQTSFPVFLGSTLGLLAADAIALTVGALLERKLPHNAFSNLSSVLFFGCGALRLMDGFSSLFENSIYKITLSILLTAMILSLFVIVFFLRRFKRRRVRGKYRIVKTKSKQEARV